MLDEFLPRRPYVPLVHSGSSNVSMAATEKPHDRTPIADVRSQSPPSPSKCNTPLFRSAQTESLDKVENVSGARIMMTAGVGPTKQPIQRSLPRFSSVSLTLMRDKLMLVVKLRKAEVAALRFATATVAAGGWSLRRSDFDFGPGEPSGIPQTTGGLRKLPLERSTKVRRSIRIFNAALFAPGSPS